MEKENLTWCFKKERGLKIIETNENLVKTYLKKSKSALNMLNSAISKDELDWVLDTSYYAKYFSVYALFMKIGIKCEIHDCTISALKIFVEEGICTKEIYEELEKSKELRINALYYEKEFGRQDIIERADKTPDFCLKIEKIINNITNDEINSIRNKFIDFEKTQTPH